MQTLTTAQAVVSMLELNGIDTLFCLPGVQNDSFFDALYDRTNAIKPIHAGMSRPAPIWRSATRWRAAKIGRAHV